MNNETMNNEINDLTASRGYSTTRPPDYPTT